MLSQAAIFRANHSTGGRRHNEKGSERMSESEQQSHDSKRNSVRVVIEGLILAGIIWMATNIQAQLTSITKLQVQVEQLSATMATFPDLSTRMTRVEMQITDLQRRQDVEDQFRERQQANQSNLRGWTK